MNASGGRGGDYEVPGGFENARGSKLLPECDVELASWRAPAHEARHHHSFPIGHTFIGAGRLTKFHSSRNAIIGSTRVARRAGM
jgi:hypothetical protein